MCVCGGGRWRGRRGEEKKEMVIAFRASSFFKVKYKKVPTKHPEPRIMHHAPLEAENNVPPLFFKDKV